MTAPRIAGLMIIAALAAGIFLRICNHDNVTVRSPDEAIYTWQSNVIIEYGGDAMGALLASYNKDKELWKLPPPTRIGYLWPLSYFMELTGIHDERAGSYLSLAFSILTLMFLAAFALKYFNGWIALYAVLMMGASAMDIAISRRAWQDAVFGGLGFILVYAASEVITGKGKALWSALFVVLGSYLILIKESGAVFYALCIMWLLFFLYRQKRFAEAPKLLAGIAAGAVCSFALLSLAAGGPSNLMGVMMHVRDGMPVNAYAVEYQTGPWYNIVLALFTISPLNTVLCLAGIVFFIARRKDEAVRPEIASGVILILLAFASVAVIAPYCQNLRYISPVFALFYLVGGIGAWHIFGYFRSKAGGNALKAAVIVIAAAVLVSAFADYAYFRKAFIEKNALDISVRVLKERPRI
ncbi:MAG: glycosyltransferase family 39 protein [Candidatus Omnitrophica bacterium]|nr:glycosyltransferase family 39 protein [Candidatus Omnitrophota bacterium]MDD5737472.1 glycosyltransferase family 39 protein [Candidatus Omnitrophota bacterium]